MVDQETVNPASGRSAARFGRNITGFAHDLATLAELQLRLFSVDLRDATRAAAPSAAILGIALIVGLGATPIILAAVAMALVEVAGWSYTAAFAAVAVCSVLVAAGLGYAGWRKLGTALRTLQRARDELVETVRWIKDSLKPSSSRSELN
jgi:uncharacterized membrane protein YqjE